MSTLRILRANAYYELKQINNQYTPSLSIEKRVSLTRLFCRCLHNIAFVAILSDADHEQFVINLIRAGENWRRVLEDARGRSYGVPASYNEALMGVIACDDITRAKEIIKFSSNQLIAPEYEDEFFYAFFIQQLVLSEFGEREVFPPLGVVYTQLYNALDGLSQTRAELCSALLEQNQVRFVESLGSLNKEFETDMEDKASNPSIPPETIMASRYIWLEGMALLNIAKHAGMNIHATFKFIPQIWYKQVDIEYQNDFILGEPMDIP
ncbi:MAG TPA: hypothetical protein DDX84_05680 [Nitrospiraceae bacterium]|nr:hypothetical protein [Nitrospiraceae bacterium]